MILTRKDAPEFTFKLPRKGIFLCSRCDHKMFSVYIVRENHAVYLICECKNCGLYHLLSKDKI